MDGVPRYPDGEGRQYQEGTEQIGDGPQLLEETVQAVTLVPRERVQQMTAEQIGNVPQFREETVDDALSVPRQRVQQADWGRTSTSGATSWNRRTAGESC